jgi:hypothetical protein
MLDSFRAFPCLGHVGISDFGEGQFETCAGVRFVLSLGRDEQDIGRRPASKRVESNLGSR